MVVIKGTVCREVANRDGLYFGVFPSDEHGGCISDTETLDMDVKFSGVQPSLCVC